MRSKVTLGFAAGVVAGLILAAVPQLANATDIDATYRRLRVFSQVLSYVQASYVDEVSEKELIYDAVSGMLADLDPHTTFMRPSEYTKLREDTAGEFGGLGLTVAPDPDGVVIEEVRALGPAENAGVKPGDKVIAVDGTSLHGLALEEAVQRLRGLPGTKVVLTIDRKGFEAPHQVALIRRSVRMQTVFHQTLLPGVGYVQIRSFAERTDRDFGDALAELHQKAKRDGQAQLRGLVVDLRDNPGGLFEEGVKVADRFVSTGKVVSTNGRNPENRETRMAHGPGTEGDYPVVILVNAGTASASEIVTGALQDQKRALVIGTTTYGKGSVQTLFGLDDGSGLKLTVARYYTPSGRSIQGTGITPDVVVKPTDLAPAAPQQLPKQWRTDSQMLTALSQLAMAPKHAAVGR